MRIIFMGTPPFAVASLAAIHKSEHQVTAVVTAPDRPAGRGRKLRPSAVKDFAQSEGIPVLQPEKLKDPSFIEELKSYRADCYVVVAFRMLPKVVWQIPPKGTFNLHASLLPNYRGAAPINWAIINGERQTGLTTFFIDEAIDTGAVIFQEKLPITAHDTAGSLHDRMMKIGGELILKTLDAIAHDTAPRLAQEEDQAKLQSAPKIFKADQKVDFNAPVESVYNHIRGLQPFPGAFAPYSQGARTINFKFGTVKPTSEESDERPGTIVIKEGNRLLIACEDRYLELLEGQPAGKKMLTARDLINGNLMEKKGQFA